MRWMRRETALLAFFAVALIAIVGLVGVGFYYSNVLKEGALVVEHTTPEPDLEVVAIGEGQVTLRITSQAEADGPWTKEGIWGLEWAGGYDQVGAILEINEREVVREFFSTTGELKIGDKVRLDSFAFADNPQKAFGLPYEEVIFSSKLGAFPAWFLNGSRSTWALFVHGRGATREESLRTLPTVVDLGFPSLIITYRNDAEAPASPSGFHDYGETEWEDLESAAHYALEQGAEELILVGYSMGGAIVMNFLYQSPVAEQVRGVILDAPVLSFESVIDFGASQKGVPGPLTELGKASAGLRFDIDWENRNYLSRVDELAVPILLFHGDADETVSIKTSDALANARPDIVTYVRVAGATHVRSWNMDPGGYEATVTSYLRDLIQ